MYTLQKFELQVVWVLMLTDLTAGVKTVTVNVDTTKSLAIVPPDFLSFMLGSGKIRHNFGHIKIKGKKFQNMLKALSPADIRLGGTEGDFLTFDEDAPENKKGIEKEEQFTMNGEQWEDLTTFAKKAGVTILLAFNVQKRKKEKWDPTNTIELLKFSHRKKIEISSFQLGNEPRGYLHRFGKLIPAKQLFDDYATLRDILNCFPKYKSRPIYGPDVTNISKKWYKLAYLKEFAAYIKNRTDVVGVLSWHHYYGDKDRTKEELISKSRLDSFKKDLEHMKNLSLAYDKPIRLTETSTCYGGGCKGLSDRYIAGFMYLDKLGLCAAAGVAAVYRQALVHAPYAIMRYHYVGKKSTEYPLPDYWLSVLFRRLVVGQRVLRAEASHDDLRVYASCASRDFYTDIPAGAIVIYYLNIGSSAIKLDLQEFKNKNLKIFALSPGGDGSLTSNVTKLNEKVLEMVGDDLPEMLGSPTKDVTVAKKRFGFIVVETAKVEICTSQVSKKKKEKQRAFHIKREASIDACLNKIENIGVVEASDKNQSCISCGSHLIVITIVVLLGFQLNV